MDTIGGILHLDVQFDVTSTYREVIDGGNLFRALLHRDSRNWACQNCFAPLRLPTQYLWNLPISQDLASKVPSPSLWAALSLFSSGL